jgi:predicted acylesterase/phospholipase RssA
MLNAILSKDFSWERYKRILFSITSSQVYSSGERRLPLNTQPLRKLLIRIVNDSLGYKVVSDLPFPTAISATSVKMPPPQRQTMRFSNRQINEESNPSYNLIDMLMASTAIPLVFPSVRIRNAEDFPEETFKDGGIFDDRIPYEAVLQYQRFSGVEIDKLIIISRKSDSVQNIQDELDNIGLRSTKVLENLGAFLQSYSQVSFIKKLMEFQQINPDLAARTYIYIPDFKENYTMLNFNTMEDQYRVTSEWAKRNQPVLLSEYLNINQIQ